MKRRSPLFVVLALCLAMTIILGACARQPAATDSGVSASTVLSQSAGVLTALATLPPAPTDPATQAQIAGWQSWAAWLAPLAANLGESLLAGRLTAASGG